MVICLKTNKNIIINIFIIITCLYNIVRKAYFDDNNDSSVLLSDEIFEQISSSTADNLKEARDILNKIIRRKLPKFVGEARLTENKSKVTEKHWFSV